MTAEAIAKDIKLYWRNKACEVTALASVLEGLLSKDPQKRMTVDNALAEFGM